MESDLYACQNWDLKLFYLSFDLLYSDLPSNSMANRIAWRLTHSGYCDVHYFYKIIRGFYGCDFPWKSIWHTKAPREIASEKILTVGNFIKRNVIFLDCCCMSKSSSESLDDLLLHCSICESVMIILFTLFVVQRMMPNKAVDVLFSWKRNYERHNSCFICILSLSVSYGERERERNGLTMLNKWLS